MPPSRSRAHPIEENILLTVTLCLLAAGAVMVYSASSSRTVLQGQGDGTSFLIKYVGYGLVGLVGMHLLARRPLQEVLRYTTLFVYAAFALLVAVKVPGIGVRINGAQRWIGAGPLQFQPAEVAKLALVLFSVRALAERPHIVKHPRFLAPYAGVIGLACLLIFSQPDLGTSLVIAFTFCALLIAAGMPVRYLGMAIGIGAALVLLVAIAEPYRRARLTAFMDPWQHAGDSGFQSVQGQIALGSGGLTGKGIGESVQKAFFLPEAHTDFILAIIGEELGVLGIAVLTFLYGLLAYAGLRVAMGASGTYAKLLAAGITSMILCQASLNIFAVLGLAPLTGVPLPFISYGSTSLVMLLASMGLLLNVARGGSAHLRVVEPSPAEHEGTHRSRRHSGARRPSSGGRRRLAG